MTDEQTTSEYNQLAEYGSWMEHPQVKELIQKLLTLESSIQQYTEKMGPLTASYESARKEYDDWEAGIREEMRVRKQAINQALELKNSINQQIAEAKALKQTLHGSINKTVQELEAARRLEEAEERWNKVVDENKWFWKEYIRPFQMKASKFAASVLESGLHGVLIADQMGLGKTLEMEAALDMIQAAEDYDDLMAERMSNYWSMPKPSRKAVLWICPNSIKITTRSELAKWNSDRLVAPLNGDPAVRDNIVRIAHTNGLTLVVNYETLSRTPAINELQWPIVVMDEAHSFKNDKSLTFTHVEAICQRAGMVFPMTGTPITNRPDEFWAILHMLTLKGKYKGKFAHKSEFHSRYCYVWGNKVEFAGPWAKDELMKQVSNMVIRRRKDEVELELPDKVREVRFVELPQAQRDLYDQMRDKFYVYLSQDEDKDTPKELVSADNILSHMTRLRQIALLPAGVKIKRDDGTEITLDCNESGKIDEAMTILEELIANEEKCLVFATTNAALFEVQRRIEAAGWTHNGSGLPVETAAIVGGVDPFVKSRIVDRFNDPNDPLRVVVGNTKAMGLGLNLQGACSHAIFLDLWWSPGVNEQAEDRLHRGGQKNAVTIHIIQSEDTIDLFIAQKLEEKINMIEGVIERKELRQAIDNGLI